MHEPESIHHSKQKLSQLANTTVKRGFWIHEQVEWKERQMSGGGGGEGEGRESFRASDGRSLVTRCTRPFD